LKTVMAQSAIPAEISTTIFVRRMLPPRVGVIGGTYD
jgi:hypothetical protein